MSLRERICALLDGKGENYIAPFFWQHGEEERVLREYMQKINQSNIQAVCVESRPHPEFLQDGWWKDLDVILDEAKKLDMKVWILDDKHFPTGYAAGAMEHADSELCHQYLDYNVLETWGPRPKMEICVSDYAKPQPAPPWMPPQPAPKRVFHEDQLFRVIACPVEERGCIGMPVDLTELVENEKILWDVPAGYWKIYVIYLTRDAKGRNDYINFLDEKSCRILIDTVYEPHYTRYQKYFGNVIAGFFSDEPPIGNTPGYTRGDLIGNPQMALPWSNSLPEAMEKEYGEGWKCFLPYLWSQGADGQGTARMRVAYMNAVSKLVSKCFSDQIGNWCQEHSVEYIGHMLEDCDSNAHLGPSMGHFFRGLSGQHMAGIDNIGGQVMPGGMDVLRHEPDMCQDSAGFYHYMLGRMGASMAAIDPKKKGRCMCENFGAYGWRLGVRTEKYLNDHFMARGVNRFVPHAFSPKDFPDPDCPPHFYAHGENPQIQAFGELMAYTNRVCQLIDGGKGEAPVALLYHGENQWAGEYESNILACRNLTQNQINFIIIPTDVLEEREKYHTVFDPEKKILSVNGNECRVLVISGSKYLTKEAASFVLEAEEAGFPVIFTGNLPEGISNTDDEKSRSMIDRLKTGKVVPVEQLAQELDQWQCRTVITEKAEKDLTVYHYQNEGEVYLLLNEDPAHNICQWVVLPKKNHVMVYDALENKLKEATTSQEGNQTKIYAELKPLEMLILICEVPDLKPEAKITAATEKIYELKEFQVSRCEATDYPKYGEWERADLCQGMAVKYPEFSGFYRYETTLEGFDWGSTELVIEDVYEAAEVFVNGISAGTRIAQPYRFAITELLKDGKNKVVVEVATTLERKAHAMGIGDGGMGALCPLAPSGIVGKVWVYERR